MPPTVSDRPHVVPPRGAQLGAAPSPTSAEIDASGCAIAT